MKCETCKNKKDCKLKDLNIEKGWNIACYEEEK
jgi:hypothetical protein